VKLSEATQNQDCAASSREPVVHLSKDLLQQQVALHVSTLSSWTLQHNVGYVAAVCCCIFTHQNMLHKRMALCAVCMMMQQGSKQ
jgi:hypothetical protein